MRLFVLILFFAIVGILSVISFRIYYQPNVLIVPHQNADVSTRSKAFERVSNSRLFTNKIILLGPDHFSSTGYEIKYASRDWKIPEGDVLYGDNILSKGYLSKISNSEIIKQDHAITNLLKDIKTNFPNAKIIPILIGMNIDVNNLDTLFDEIRLKCGFDCLVITSVDFSHYLPYPSANIHDEYSRYLLESNSYNLANSMEVDSPQSLYLAMRLADQQNMHFTFLNNSNSAQISNNPNVESTGHVLGYYSRKISPSQNPTNNSFTLANGANPQYLKLGQRYFYGTKRADLNLNTNFLLNNLEIIPYNSPDSTFVCNNDTLEIKLGSNILIIGDSEKNLYIYPKAIIRESVQGLPCVVYNENLNRLVVD